MRIGIYIILLALMMPMFGQDDLDLPDLSNYQHNWMIYNPAYTGSRDVLSGGLYSRSLKIKDPGGPFYTQLSLHTPTKNEKVAIGVYGSIQRSPAILWPISSGVDSRYTDYQLYGSYAYRIPTPRGRFSFGLYGGATFTTASFSKDFLNAGDPKFPDADFERIIRPNIGTGVLYYTEKLFFGVSIPRLLPARSDSLLNSSNPLRFSSFFRKYTTVISGGYEFSVNENITISPTFLMLYGFGEDPLDYATGINFGFFDKKIWFGSVYKSANSIAFNANFQLSNKLLLGISYDYSINKTNTYFKNAFELVLRFELRETVQTNIPFYY